MGAITINVPAGTTNRVLDAISTKYGYQTQILDNSVPPVLITNPQNKAEFVRQWIITQIKNAVKEHEAGTASAAAGATAAASVNTDIVIT